MDIFTFEAPGLDSRFQHGYSTTIFLLGIPFVLGFSGSVAWNANLKFGFDTTRPA